MAKAAAHLGVTQPSVSKSIRDLEVALGVRLFDRSPQGVELTRYGGALQKCGSAVFDELRQGIKSIEFLSDPDAGEVRIGSAEPMMAGFIPAIIDRLAREHSRIVFHTIQGVGHALLTALRERRVDLVVSGSLRSIGGEDLVSEVLFSDHLLIVAGLENRWSRRRKIDLSELLDEPWILPETDSMLGTLITKDFHSSGLAPPRSSVLSNSMTLRNRLLATGRYLSVMPRSMLHFGGEQLQVKILPVRWPGVAQPTEIITLKNRTLSPAVDLFIACARETAKAMVARPQSGKT